MARNQTREAGKLLVKLLRDGVRPRQIVTRASLDNATAGVEVDTLPGDADMGITTRMSALVGGVVWATMSVACSRASSHWPRCSSHNASQATA